MHSLRRPGNHFYIVLIYGFFLLCASNQFASGAENEAPALNVEQLRERFTNESSAELASFKLGDADVSLNVSGSWKATLQGNLGLSFSPTGTQAISPDTPILFTQESDVTLDLRILDKWFVEASVLNNLDNYAFNTYRAGYEGAPGELVQYAGIGNTGLDFPVFPYLDLGGDSASSFGFYGKFAAGPYTFHSLFRWDQAAREERTFVGARERSYVYVAPDDSERGVSFVLPNTMLDSDTQIFVEDEKGSLRDTDGRHWRQLGPSEYAAGRASGLVELAQSPAGMVAAAYSKGGSQTPWAEIPAGTEALGKYGDPAMPGSGSGFLGEAQGYFGQEVNLSLYPQCGETGALPHTPGSRLINGTPALVIYENGTFSPFERRSRYAAPSSASTDAALVRLPTLDLVPGYELVQLEASAITPDIPLYADSVVQRAYFDLIKENGSTDNRNPEKRWPMAADNPGFYLPGAVTSETNISIRFTNYGSPGLFVIGTDVVPGSVQVWRSGIIDPNFTFNASSGTVSLANPAGFSEVIRITYLKRSSESQMGSVAAGLGAEYHKDGSPFQSQLAMGLRWNLNQGDTFTEEGVSNPGNVGLSAKTSWEFDHLKARITGGLNFEQPDSTGLYRAAGMEGNQVILDLAPDTSFVSYPPESASAIPLFSGLDISNRSDLIYRNYRDPASVSNNLMTIDWNGSRIVPAVNRPYPVRDPQLTSKTNVLAMEFSLDDTAKWTGYQTPITDDTGILARAKEIEIPYRFYGFDGPVPPDFKLVLQIGALAGEDYSYTENTALIYEKLLYGADMADAPDNPAAFDTNARIASFTISDSDRLALGDARCIRIIVTHTGTETINGRVILAPPIIRGASFRPIILGGTTVYDAQNYSSGFTVQTQEMPETDPNSSLQSAYPQLIKRLHPDGTTQQVLYVQWDDMDSFNAAGADGRIGSLPLSSYRMMSFFLKGPQRADGTEFSDGAGGAGGVVNFLIAQGTSSFAKTGEQYITAEIPLSAFQPGKWSKVSIRYQGSEQGVYVDNKAVSGAVFKYRQLPQLVVSDLPPGKSMYTAVTISPVSLNSSAEPMQGNYLPAGNFSIDEIILEEPAPLYRLSGGMMAEYNRPGTLAAIRNFPVLADFSASSALESEVHGDPFTGGQDSGSGVSSRSNAGITVLGTKIAGNLAFNAVSGDFNWNAGHEISRSFGPFDAAESFAVSPLDDTLDHRVTLGLSKFVRTRFNAEMNDDLGRRQRKWNLLMGLGGNTVNSVRTADGNAKQLVIPSVNIDAMASWTSKMESLGEKNYGEYWTESWRPIVPDLGRNEDTRETRSVITINENTKPVGANLTLEGTTLFTGNINTTNSGNRVALELPLIINTTLLNVKMERGFKKNLLYSGDDARDDGMQFIRGIQDALPLWGVFPFYSIFSPDLGSAMDSSLKSSRAADTAVYTWFNDLFGVSGQFQPYYDLRSFFVPINSTISFQRVLEQKMDTRLDVLYLKGNIGFSSINMFGAFGYKPLFKVYQSDEYSNALDVSIAIPTHEQVSYRLQWSAAAVFRGFTGSELAVNNTLTLGSSGWLEGMKFDWSIPAKKSLLGTFYDWIAKTVRTQSSWLGLSKLMDKSHEQLRTESLELTFDHSGDYLSWSVLMGHESIIRLVGQFYFSVFTKLNITGNELTKTQSFDVTVGTTLNIMF